MSRRNNTMTSVERYGHRAGESPDEIKKRATGYVARFIHQGGRLVVGFAGDNAGQIILTIAVAVGGEFFRSPSLDALALGMGALTGLRFLVESSRYRNRHGSIAIAPEEIAAWEKTDNPELTAGDWTGDDQDDWQP